jgi:hypothetical protein
LLWGCSPLLEAGDTTFEEQSPQHVEAGTPEASVAPMGPAGLGIPVRLEKPDAPPDPSFGTALAITSNTLVVAAPFENVTTERGIAKRAGALYVFDLEDMSRERRLVLPNADDNDGAVPTELLPSDVLTPATKWPTMRLAMSDQLLVVGVAADDSASSDPYDNSAPESGAVWIYDRNDYDHPQYLKAPDPKVDALFGGGLALSEPWLAIGAPGESGGAVYMYRRDPLDGQFKAWGSEPVKAPNPTGGDLFGLGVAVDGERLVVGAVAEDSDGTGFDADPSRDVSLASGAAYFYRLDGEQWKFEKYVKPLVNTSVTGPATFFGFDVAIAGDTVAIGAPGARVCGLSDKPGANRGAVFLVDTVQWTEECVAPDTAADTVAFGWAVHSMGDRIFVSAPFDSSKGAGAPSDENGSVSGAIYVLQGSARAFVKLPVPIANSTFGLAVAVAGGRVAATALEPSRVAGFETFPDGGIEIAGAVYVYPPLD